MTSGADWTGRVGHVWATEWQRTDRSFADLSRHLDAAIAAAAPTAGLAIDIGCGAGTTTLALGAARPDLEVVGLDLSPELVAIARERAAGRPNIRFRTADVEQAGAADLLGADLPRPDQARPDLPRPDLLVSRHGVMFFDDPVGTFTRLGATARPGAGLVFSCFRAAALNPWASELVEAVTGAAPRSGRGYVPGPFGLADRDLVADILSRSGWHDAEATAVDYRYVAGAGADPVADAVSFLRRIGPIARALRDAPEAARAAMLDKLARALQKRREQDEIAFPAAAWIWRARAPGG